MANGKPESNEPRLSEGLVNYTISAALEEMTAPECSLSPAKIAVLRELAAGNGVVKAAEAAGVGRRTVSHWMRNDPEFVATLNAWRNQSVRWARDQMVATLGEAAATVRQAIQNGDSKLAMQLLKLQQVVGPVEEGLESAEEIHMDRGARRRSRTSALVRREVVSMNREIARHPLYGEFRKRQLSGVENRSWTEFLAEHNRRMRFARQGLQAPPEQRAIVRDADPESAPPTEGAAPSLPGTLEGNEHSGEASPSPS
ncbi:MAG: hypothetical protein JWM97_2706 [Phycisphaerales bacterium]|nr:hypothetical protein [Phycisphaerales bacterium]MDB5305157.1 hypothetical protein [Phycisphaerales bacterium]